MSNNYVYFIYDGDGSIGYVGIGDRARPYGPHTKVVDDLRDRSGDVRITSMPFSTRGDAERAESLIIRALADAEEHGTHLLNVAKRKQSKDLVPLLPFQQGILRYSDLSTTLLVKISLNAIDDERVVVSGAAHSADAAERCSRYWPLGKCVDREAPIKRLVAVTTAEAKPVRVVGVWDVDHTSAWKYHEDVQRWEVRLTNPVQGNIGGHVGKCFDWEGYAPQNVGYSSDIRTYLGLG
ncbi:hypothetical protein AB0I52_01940 [Streptomyces sp. NPDC050423]|uniref:hypothetical protein n=1 Tax=Streptomyces sp. NPDC050423 TaxID=3155402 RepID=UPI00343E6FDF